MEGVEGKVRNICEITEKSEDRENYGEVGSLYTNPYP